MRRTPPDPEPPPAAAEATVDDLTAGAVDVYDLAARLEMSGQGLAAAQRQGYSSTFDLAAAILEERQSGVSPASTAVATPTVLVKHRLIASLQRVIIMVAGVLVCLMALPAHSPATLVFASGAVGWITGQAVAAAAWSGVAARRRGAVGAYSIPTALAGLSAAAVVAGVLGSPLILVWALWATATAILTVVALHWRLTASVAALGGLTALTRFTISPTAAAWAATAAAVGVTIAAAVALHRMGMARHRLPRSTVESITAAALQAVGQIGCLLLALVMAPPETHLGIALAGLICGVFADPALEMTMLSNLRGALRSTRWESGQRTSRVLAAASVGIIGGVAVIVMSLVSPELTLTASAAGIGGALILASLTSVTGVYLRMGHGTAAGALPVATAVTLALLMGYAHYFHGPAAWISLGSGLALTGLAIHLITNQLRNPVAWMQ